MKHVMAILALAAIASGCAAGGQACSKHSETANGGGLYGIVSKTYGLTSVGLLGSYSRLSFDGGYDNLYAMGVQARRRFGAEGQANRWWFGGELTFDQGVTVLDIKDMFDGDPKANGYSVGALLGYTIPGPGVDFNLFTSVSLLSFGEFKTGGEVAFEGDSHTYFRFGGEVVLPF